MKRKIIIAFISFLLLSGAFSNAVADTPAMENYCQAPPFISTGASPNIFFVIDASGSMGWNAYSCTGSSCGTSVPYDSNKTYEGYFNPAKSYNQDGYGIWTEASAHPCHTVCDQWTCYSDKQKPGGSLQKACQYNPSQSCSADSDCGQEGPCIVPSCISKSKPWARCTASHQTGSCSTGNTGNYLNYSHMHRIDLLRWAMTGGRPDTCRGQFTFNNNSCDPELYNQSGSTGTNGVGNISDPSGPMGCSDALQIDDAASVFGGCVLRADDGSRIRVPWYRVNSGLAPSFKGLAPQPRMGVFFFSDSGIRSAGQVYVGDFTAPNSTDINFPFMNLITAVNSTIADGGTPTGPAMWDTLNYFKQVDGQYGGPAAQSGSGDRWKNPLYVCDGGGINCVLVPCARNFVMLLSDGQWNQNGSGQTSCSIDNTDSNGHSTDPVVPAHQLHAGFTNTKAIDAQGNPVSTNINAVYAIGLFLGGTGRTAMENIAMYGSFDRTGRTWPDSLTGYPQGTCTIDDCGSGKGSSCTALPAPSYDWDKYGRVDPTDPSRPIPDTFYSASEGQNIKTSILNAVIDALRRTSSGTAVSMLASSQGSGANLLQAVFFPDRVFIAPDGSQTDVTWTSELENLWYYLDPTLTVNTIREDTDKNGILNPSLDNIIHFTFTEENRAQVQKEAAAAPHAAIGEVSFEDLDTSLWRAGLNLFSKSAASRRIKTTINGSSLTDFTTGSAGSLQNYLNAGSLQEAQDIISYVRGSDDNNANFNNYSPPAAAARARTASIDLNKNGTIDSNETQVWKLGDIISSTPKVQSFAHINAYHLDPPAGYSDNTYAAFIGSNDYQSRGMVYAGANDGMLHAFGLGRLVEFQQQSLSDNAAQLLGNSNSVIGQEAWAFIPKNALPYLKYLADPDYCHLDYVDLPVTIVDASINPVTGCSGDYWDCARATTVDASNNLTLSHTSWRTILIGGMGFGGACRKPDGTDYQGRSCPTSGGSSSCVKAPIMDPADGSKALGLSSYFALDITDQKLTPAVTSTSTPTPDTLPVLSTVKWEFSDPRLGFATSGPAIVRVGDKTKNGRWFAVFASGPTGWIDTSSHQFMGVSTQNLQLFVVDLNTGQLVTTFDTGITNAFGGSLNSAALDTDRLDTGRPGNYQDEVVYIGYTQCASFSGITCTSWDGGVLRLVTKEDANPNNWSVSTVISGTGPVTSAVTKLQDVSAQKLWIYFGTGRYYFKQPDGTIDDANGRRRIYGIQEPCYNTVNRPGNYFDATCTASQTGTLDDRTTYSGICAGTTSTTCSDTNPCSGGAQCVVSPSTAGWYINLLCSATDSCSWGAVPTGFSAERVITDPLAAFNGAVFFTTFSPTADICGFNGNTYVWAVGYNSGAQAPAGSMVGTALLQVSTGAISELGLSSVFSGSGGRKTAAVMGMPPRGQGLSVIVPPPPLKKFMHIREQ